VDTAARRALESLLKHRLVRYAQALRDLHKRHGGGAATLEQRGSAMGLLDGTVRVQCTGALRDGLVLLRMYDGLDSAAEIRELFDGFADQVSADFCRTFSATAQTDRNRAANVVGTLKAECHRDIDDAVERAERARRAAESGEGGTMELDDRLPLGRRAAFDRDIRQAVEHAKRNAEPCALVMADIDHFKSVNDQHGHPVGDEVLLGVAQRMVSRVGIKGNAYRYGGEEFAVLLLSYSAEEAAGLADRIRKDIEAAPVGSKKLLITASFGAASVPCEASDATLLLKAADTALYEAKHTGRNKVCVAPPKK
jgi:diguanylate cyclase (GGDEF)-like protein